MNADKIYAFNQRKASIMRAMAPVTVVFDHAESMPVRASFGVVTVEAGLNESGQSMDIENMGVLYFPRFPSQAETFNPPDFPPRHGHAFTITASRDEALVNTRWQCGHSAHASTEPTIKFNCTKLQP